MVPDRVYRFARIEDEGIRLAERNYGRGRGDGLSPRGYHNAAHAEMVVRNVRTLLDAADSGVTGDNDRALLPLAAAWHDAVYEPGRHDNEALSAALLRERILRAGAPPEIALRAAELVLATRASVGTPEGGYFLVQAAADTAGRLLCDADVGYWGLPWDEMLPWWQGLACEISGLPGDRGDFERLPAATVRGFLAYQAELLGNHRYLTAAAEGAWGPERDRNVARSLAEASRYDI